MLTHYKLTNLSCATRTSTGGINDVTHIENAAPQASALWRIGMVKSENRMKMKFMFCVCHRYVIGWIWNEWQFK